MANKGSFLATGQYLSVGDYLVSDNGEFFAVMQSDGNFVFYRGSGPSDNQGYIFGKSAIPRYQLASTLPLCRAMAISSSTMAATRPIRALRSGRPIPFG